MMWILNKYVICNFYNIIIVLLAIARDGWMNSQSNQSFPTAAGHTWLPFVVGSPPSNEQSIGDSLASDLQLLSKQQQNTSLSTILICCCCREGGADDNKREEWLPDGWLPDGSHLLDGHAGRHGNGWGAVWGGAGHPLTDIAITPQHSASSICHHPIPREKSAEQGRSYSSPQGAKCPRSGTCANCAPTSESGGDPNKEQNTKPTLPTCLGSFVSHSFIQLTKPISIVVP
jgi:hypothetical protein